MRILFADDSMTAQNMGKKILTEAGYEVVAVSNGAAAVKKIAEQKPDIIILDIYMPGYSGLEVCDKVRASAETLRTPVLLTVGKMEPYRAEDANRVRADGVIIKPFEASDLLAVVKKLEERVVPKTVAMAEDTILLERPPEFAEFPSPGSEQHGDHQQNTVQATVDVPDNMATTAAFSDFLGVEPSTTPDPVPTPEPAPAVELSVSHQPPVEPSAPPVEFASVPTEEVSATEPSPSSATASDQELETSAARSSTSAGEGGPVEETRFVSTASPGFGGANVEEINTQTEAGQPVASAHSQPFPVYHESHAESAAASSTPAELLVAGEGSHEVHASPSESEPDHAVVFAAATMAAPEPPPSFIDPGMAVDSFSAKIESEIQKIETIVSASEARHAEVKPAENGFAHHDLPAEVEPSADDDFEARVAAAMSIYDEPAEGKVEATVEEPKPAVSKAALASTPLPGYFEAPRSFEYSPPISAAEPVTASEPEVVSEEAEPAIERALSVEPAPEPVERYATLHENYPNASEQQIAAQPEPGRVEDEQIISEIEAQLPAAVATSTDPGSQTQVIADVIHRVLERLKPQLIEEISRELKSKK